jgi:hypothetical protein
MLKLYLLVVLGLMTASCPLTLPQSPSPCATEKISFTQENGCLNDGSFEFCIPQDDPEALAAVLEIAPTAACLKGSRGRAGCDLETQMLCLVNRDGMCAANDAMNDTGWQTVCELASLPSVEKIVPTWYE